MDEISLVEVGKLSIDFDKVLSASSEDVFDEFMLTVDFNELSNEIGLSAANLNNKIVTQNDISSLVGAMHFRGVVERQEEETDYEAIQRAIYDPQPGDVAIMQDNYKEYVYNGTNWVELGDEALYATKAEVSAGFLNLSNDYVQKISDLSDETYGLIDLVSTETLISANYYVDNEISLLSNEIDFLVNDISTDLSDDYVERIDYLEESLVSLVNDISTDLSDDYINKIDEFSTLINNLLANVFAETYTSAINDANSYTDEQIESLSIDNYALSNNVSNELILKQDKLTDEQIFAIDSAVDERATVIDFGNDDISTFYWVGELNIHTFIDEGLCRYDSSSGNYIWLKPLYSVKIGTAITKIGLHTFYMCNTISNIIIPNSVTNIGSYAFFDCENLSNIVIPNSVTSMSRAFVNCYSLTDITIPNSISSIDIDEFSYCNSLSNIVIPDSVINIGAQAFAGCRSLSNIVIPDSVINIGNYVFGNCEKLTSIVVKGKTQAEADALLANASVPSGCEIIIWNDASQEWVSNDFISSNTFISALANAFDLARSNAELSAMIKNSLLPYLT